MSYNGSGTFNINSAGQPVVTGTVISSTAFNALTADLGTGLSTAITKDGQTVATARIPFAAGINSSLVTDATNTTTGSIITAGGVGIAKALFVGTTANIAGTTTLSGLTASTALALDASKNVVSVTNTGTGSNVLATTPTLVGDVNLSTGNLVIGTSGKGIDFSATSGTGTSELLADYEEGTWTMGVSFGGGTTGITYNASYVTGSYTKIGNRVFISGVLVLTNKGSSTGSALLTGLPFTISSSASAASAFSQVLYNATFTGQQFLETNGGSTTAYLWQVSVLGVRSALTDANFANDSQLTVGGSYIV